VSLCVDTERVAGRELHFLALQLIDRLDDRCGFLLWWSRSTEAPADHQCRGDRQRRSDSS
jgi:hypothetical protein